MESNLANVSTASSVRLRCQQQDSGWSPALSHDQMPTLAQANNFADDGVDGDDEVVLVVGEDGGSTAVRVPRQVMHVR